MTAEAKAMAARGVDVIDFAAGEPDLDTPDAVKEAGIAAIRAGFTKYTASGGIDELKVAVIDKLKRDQGLAYDKSQILISCGAKHSLYNLGQALFEAGDKLEKACESCHLHFWYPNDKRAHQAALEEGGIIP